LGIPEDMNSTIIALGRMAGWAAHWREAIAGRAPIVRPRDLHDGLPPRRQWPL
jgi:citrate synthase